MNTSELTTLFAVIAAINAFAVGFFLSVRRLIDWVGINYALETMKHKQHVRIVSGRTTVEASSETLPPHSPAPQPKPAPTSTRAQNKRPALNGKHEPQSELTSVGETA